MSDRLWRKRGPDGQPTGSWYGAYLDAEGKRRLVCTRQLDRQAARTVVRELERQAAAPRGAAADPTLTVGDACRRAGIEPVSPNDLRRAYASWLKQRGVDSAAVAKLLGHASTRMVDLVYGHLSDDTLASAVAVLPPTRAVAY